MRTTFIVVALSALFACNESNPSMGDDFPDPPCSDGKDNDKDGDVDFPDDLGCIDPTDESEDSGTMPECNDGRDNDGDGKTDYPNDPGCLPEQADSEAGDDCPDGMYCPQCSNGKDDDGNGTTDYPNDPGCESAGDNLEFVLNSVACGAQMTIRQLPANGEVMGTLDSMSTSMVMSPCGGGGGVPAVAFALFLTEPKVIVASTDQPGTQVDTVLDIRSAACTEASSEIACNDDIGGITATSKVTASLGQGTYYVIVSSQNAAETGMFALKVEKFNGEGSACTDQAQCGPGLICRTPSGGSQQICTDPVCSDGLDDDNDGKTDHPNDPGCASPSDADEVDDCPSGPNCPDCADGVDNDNDTKTDFPMDTSCKAAGDASEACTTSEPIDQIVGPTTMGTTVGATNDYDPSCNSTAGAGPDRMHRIDLPAMSSLTLALVNLSGGFDTVSVLLNSSCGGTEVKCSDPTSMLATNLAAGTYYFVVDAWSTASGTYTIMTSGTIAPGGSCEGQLYASGAIACPMGFVCDGMPGAKTCRTQCTDGLDNNSNGKTDYPNDPGCATPADNDENTVCPGAMCPACADGVDNDGDTKIDYPMDNSCVAAGGTSESCQQTEPIGVITTASTMGMTTGATNDYQPVPGQFNGHTCSTTLTHTAPDVAYQIDLPAMQTVSINLTGATYDTSHTLLDSSCTGTPVECFDSTNMLINGLAAGRYFLVVDGYSTGSGSYTISVSGQVAPGGSCESALFTSGALTCTPGTVCAGSPGTKTCRSQCSDGVDNNGDGKTDYPFDPSCMSLVDDSEQNVCPGALCPVCSNGVDEDTDSTIDFPADFGCPSAAGSNETFCGVEPNFAGVIATPLTNGTLATAANNYTQTCQGFNGADVAYALKLPVMVQKLEIDTLQSLSGDTILSLKDSNCGTQIACADDSGTGTTFNLSKITAAMVPAGNYAIQVDSYGTNNNLPFKLAIKGTVAPGTVCTNVLFSQGVLVCPTGTTCTGGSCQ